MPHDLPLLGDLLLLLLASIPIAFLFHRLRLPTTVGFMITGIVIGPYGLGLIKDVHAIEVLAEIGVVLLLFTKKVLNAPPLAVGMDEPSCAGVRCPRAR